MSEYGGFAICIDDSSAFSELETNIDTRGIFTDTIQIRSWDINLVEMCAVFSDSSTIRYICLLKPSNKVASSSKYRYKLFNPIVLEQPVVLDPKGELYASLSENVVNVAHRYGSFSALRIQPTNWRGFIHHIKGGSSQKDVEAIDRLEALRQALVRSYDVDDPIYQVMAMEHDALVLSFKLAGAGDDEIEDSLLQLWVPSEANSDGYWEALKEREMSRHDATTLNDEGYRLVPHRSGENHFVAGDKQLTVRFVDNTSIEHKLGVDLYYYNREHGSFVMVQYKRMLPSKDKRTQGIFEYEPDKNYVDELARMMQFQKNHPSTEDDDDMSTGNYRLNSGVFYFKLCPSLSFTPYSAKLSNGMYIPLNYWNQLVCRKDVQSQRSGKEHRFQITIPKVERSLSNTLFIELVKHGWIGSRVKTSISLDEVVKLSSQSGRPSMIATDADEIPLPDESYS